MFPSSSKLQRSFGFFLWCSLLWQSWHNASKLSQHNVIYGLFIFSLVSHVLWWHIFAGSPQRSHIPFWLSKYASLHCSQAFDKQNASAHFFIATTFLQNKTVACCRGSGCLLLSSCYHIITFNIPLKPQVFTTLSPLPANVRFKYLTYYVIDNTHKKISQIFGCFFLCFA